MTPSSEQYAARRKFIALAILTVGFVSALLIYVAAAPAPPSPTGYELEDSKQYLRDMELYGGKANLIASELRQWFDGLWRGRRLAVTVAFLTLVTLLLYLVISTPLPPTDGQSPPRKHMPEPADP